MILEILNFIKIDSFTNLFINYMLLTAVFFCFFSILNYLLKAKR